MDEFLKWLEKQDVSFSGLKPVSFADSGWGLVCEEEWPPEKVLLSIPDHIIITSETVAESYLGKFFKKNAGLFKPFEALAIWLTCECLRGESSFWHPYIQILPQSFTNPVCFTGLPVESLPPSVIPLLLDQKAEFARFYAKTAAVTTEIMNSSRQSGSSTIDVEDARSLWDLLCWSWCAVNTRCIYKPGPLQPDFDNSDGDCLALVPFIDLLNHSPKTRVQACYSPSRNCYDLISHTTVFPGKQLFVCYGPHSNPKLFVEYGFVSEENPTNGIHLTVEDVIRLAHQCSLQITEKHEEVLRKANFPCYLYETSEEPSWGVMAAFKILTMTRDELRNWQIVYNCDDLSYDLALLKCVKTVLCAFYSELEELMKLALLEYVPTALKPMVNLLWADELRIVKQSITQVDDLEIEAAQS